MKAKFGNIRIINIMMYVMIFFNVKPLFTQRYYLIEPTEGTDIVVNSIADDVWSSEDELTGVLSDKVESWG